MVDDDTIVADTLVMVLNFGGYDAVAAYSGESALEMAGLTAFDKSIMDVTMEPMTGVQAAIALARLHPKCQILLMSGNELAAKLLQEAAEAGHPFEILAKPVHPSVLLDYPKGQPPQLSVPQ